MIYSIEGQVEILAADRVAVKMKGPDSSLQFILLVPRSLIQQNGKDWRLAKFYTHLIWRETGPTLFGFAAASQVALFEQLNDVSGVGPKTALALIDKLDETGLAQAVLSEDFASLAQVAGVGKKTAQRIVIDLKGKIHLAAQSQDAQPPSKQDLHSRAEQALIHLGYSQKSAKALIQQVETEEPSASVSDLIARALRFGAH